jgi:hypothetical protein
MGVGWVKRRTEDKEERFWGGWGCERQQRATASSSSAAEFFPLFFLCLSCFLFLGQAIMHQGHGGHTSGHLLAS